MTDRLVEQLRQDRDLSDSELKELIKDPSHDAALTKAADEVRHARVYGGHRAPDPALPDRVLARKIRLCKVQRVGAVGHEARIEIQAEVVLQRDVNAGAHLLHGVQEGRVVHHGGGVDDRVVVVEDKALAAQGGDSFLRSKGCGAPRAPWIWKA